MRRNPVIFLPVCFNAHKTTQFLATGVSPQKMLFYLKKDTSRITLFNKDPPFQTPLNSVS